ncbi:phosphoglycolate phosphatase [Brumimicrobium oceani]|uniref:phosphoglycolate phosphatase n=1 Tax=Brumimicrobium oceani TaxID=2100725 RepID=A0A2U2XHE8_9FLAO|nr:phosphoglycolate phosphatase [Brumimicrobium oceani]PWH87141.1 phosphoglycolate phosphatase [Brumimicrobium oceani]
MNFTNKELIIFDFDGTLINSIPDLTSALNVMLAHYNLTTLTIEQVTPFIGNGAKPLVKRALEASLQSENLGVIDFNEAFDVYLSAYTEITCKDTFLYPGVKSTLEYLNEKGYKLAICTNKPFEFIAPILETLQIKGLFKKWIGENSLPQKKPNELPLVHLAKELDSTIEKTVMVGDSKNDILAAQNAKMESIGVSYGYNYFEDISDYNPTVVVDNFEDLQSYF